METYVDLFFNADGDKASVVHKKLSDLGLKPTIGGHDYVYNWNGLATIDEEMVFIDNIQSQLKGTGVFLRFSTTR